MAQSGNLGNESTGTLIADASATAARLAPFEPRKIINQDHQPRSSTKIINQDQNTRQDMLQSNEVIRHGSLGQKSRCRIPPALNSKRSKNLHRNAGWNS
jgi:hypothetical protein